MRYPHEVRIIAGEHRSRKIKTPEDKSIRPTSNRSREAIFNMLSHARNGMSVIYGARVLDLFCGTGAMGLECLSRGAEHATFLDTRTDIAKENIESLGEQKRATLLTCDYKNLPEAGQAADIIFIDPPYDSGLVEPALQLLKQRGWIHDRTIIVAESSSKEMYKVPSDYNKFDERVYGASRFSFLVGKAA